MNIDVLLGLQWGDEGKGKIVDYLATQYDLVARFQGGPNAGHTLEFDGHKHVLHQIPSGIFRENITNVIGNGVVLDPIIFKREIEALDQKFGLDPRKNLYISKKAQLILPSHRTLDACYEKSKGIKKIGSTLKGIGPTYQDKIARTGLRVADILNDQEFRQKYHQAVEKHKMILDYYQYDCDLEKEQDQFFDSIEFLRGFQICDTEYLVNDNLLNGKKVLAEGAQGALLDIDHGSYPFVTSSNTTVAGACSGLGVAPSRINEVIGIFKAYCTRVGSGPFPTELFDEAGEKLRVNGSEFGSTTGRPRRCGWLDLPALKYSIMINGVSRLYMMKADVLNDFEEIKIGTSYEDGEGKVSSRFISDMSSVKLNPVYETFQGWNQDVSNYKEFDELPESFKNYVNFIERKSSVPVTLISLGADRDKTIKVKD